MTDKNHTDTTPTLPTQAELTQTQASGSGATTPESAQPAAPPPSPKGGKGLATLALLIALGAGAGSGYLWYLWDKDRQARLSESATWDARLEKAVTQASQQRDAEVKTLKDQLLSQQTATQTLKSDSQSLKGASESLQSAVQILRSDFQALQAATETQRGDSQIRKNQIQALQDQVQALQGNLQALNDQFSAYAKEQQRNLAQLDTRMENLQLAERSLLTTLENIKTVIARGGDVNALPLAEVEYLLRIADHKLKLQRDVPGAIEALRIAEQHLKGMDENAFLGVQRMIAENIASLRGVDLPDRPALAHKIVEMEQRVNNLPLRNQAQLAELREKVKPRIGEDLSSTEPSERSWWERAGNAAWTQLKDILVIRHERSSAPPLIAVQEEYFLLQNLRLELEAMRLALLNNDAASFQAANQLARNWLEIYFDGSDAGVSELLAELKALQALQFNPYVPDIGGTLLAFREVMERRQPVRSVLPAEGISPAPAKEMPQ